MMMTLKFSRAAAAVGLGLSALLMATSAYAADINLGKVPPGVNASDIQKLYADARSKGEDKVVIVSNDRRFGPLEEFTKRFPGIAIANDVVPGGERATVIMSQHRARRVEYDLVEGTGGVLNPLNEAGALAKGDYKVLGYPADDVIANLAIYADSVMVHGYNPKVVKKEELPKTFADFKSEKWKGRLTGDPFSFNAGWAFIGTVDGEKAMVDLATGIHETTDLVLSGAAQDLVDSGEKGVFMFNNITRVIQAQKAGSPVQMYFMDGLGVARFGLGQTTLAPHPNAAKLFLYWIRTEEGQKSLFDHSSAALAKNVDSPVARIVNDANVKFTFETEENWRERGRLTAVMQRAITQKR
jgi:ABC-type Fe3+ transport system substrate-binding protein